MAGCRWVLAPSPAGEDMIPLGPDGVSGARLKRGGDGLIQVLAGP